MLLLASCQAIPPAPLEPGASADRLEGRTLADPGLARLGARVEAELGRPVLPAPGAPWDLAGLTVAALHFHPDIAAARSAWRVAQAAVVTAGARPNPTLGLHPEYVTNAASGVSPWIGAVSLDWPIETAGKRGHRLDEAERHAQAVALGLVTAAWEVRGELRAALAAKVAADERADALAAEEAVQDQLVAMLEEQVEAGAIARAQLEPQRLAALQTSFDLADARGRRHEAQARLAAALGLPAAALAKVEVVPPPPSDDEALGSREARRRALLGRADVRAALADYAASEAALALELAKQVPDLHLGTGYQFDQGADKWQLGVSLELPLLAQNQGPIAEAKARRDQAAAHFEAVQEGVIAEVDAAVAAQRAAREQRDGAVSLLEGRERQAEQARQAFAAGALDRVGVRAAELEVARGRRLLAEARGRLLEAEARLEHAVQPPLPLLAATLDRSLEEEKP